MDVDSDEEIPLPDLHRTIRRGITIIPSLQPGFSNRSCESINYNFPKWCFDMRGKKIDVEGKNMSFVVGPTLERYFQLENIAKKFQIPKEWVHCIMDIVVISKESNFILCRDVTPDDTRHTSVPQCCITITSTTTIGELVAIVAKDVSRGKTVSFISKCKPLDKELIINSRFQKEDYLSFVVHAKVRVEFFYSTRADVESKYTISCYNVSSIRDMKDIFIRTFSGEFPGLASGEDGVWFTQGKHLVGHEEHPFLTFGNRRHNLLHTDQSRMQIQIKPANSFPVGIKFTSPDNEKTSRILLVSLPLSTEQLRCEISTITTCPSSAMELFVNKAALKETSLSAINGIVANCSVHMKTTKSITVVLEICGNATRVSKKVELYKLYRVRFFKDYLSDQYAPRDLKLMFHGKEIEDDLFIDDYRIRNGDVIEVQVLVDPIHLRVRHPGHLPYVLTVCNHKTVTVLQVREYLAVEFSTNIGKLNIIYRDRCLDDRKSLYDNGVSSDSIILIPRVTEGMRTPQDDVINTMYICDTEGNLSSRLSTQIAGVTFYAPEWVSHEDLQTKTTGKEKQTRPEIIIRRPKIDMNIPSPSLTESSLMGDPSSRTSTDQHPLPRTAENASRVEDLRVKTISKTTGSAPDIQELDNLSLSKSDQPCQKETRMRCYRNGRPSSDISPGFTSDPGNSAKRFTYCKELTEMDDRLVFRESSFYEENVSKDEANDRFHKAAICQQVQSSESASSLPEKNVFTASCLTFPAEAVQTSVLEAVARELGNDWKRVAISLGLESKDIERIEYKHIRDLHEQALEALREWRKRQSKNATIEKLKGCLRECELNFIADSLNDNVKYETE